MPVVRNYISARSCIDHTRSGNRTHQHIVVLSCRVLANVLNRLSNSMHPTCSDAAFSSFDLLFCMHVGFRVYGFDLCYA